MNISRPGRPGIPGLLAAGSLFAGVVVLLLMLALQGPPGQAPLPAGSTEVWTTDSDERATEHEGFALWGTDRTGGPLRWDACAPVLFVLSTVDAPPSAADDVQQALDMLAAASGLSLVLDGTSDERAHTGRPLVERDGEGWRWMPVLIAWAGPDATDLPLTALDRGLAVPVAVRDGDREGLVTGQVVINASRTDLVPGFGDRSDAVGATLLHELGHVLGLDHVDDIAQVMSEDPGSGPVRFGDGDLAGLRAVGADAGCNPAPAPESGRGLVARP